MVMGIFLAGKKVLRLLPPGIRTLFVRPFERFILDSKERTKRKLTEAEIAWLMTVLNSRDCNCCIWREKEEARYQCLSNRKSPCAVFADKVFSGLEKSGLI
jgi:hypothetical protein